MNMIDVNISKILNNMSSKVNGVVLCITKDISKTYIYMIFWFSKKN